LTEKEAKEIKLQSKHVVPSDEMSCKRGQKREKNRLSSVGKEKSPEKERKGPQIRISQSANTALRNWKKKEHR